MAFLGFDDIVVSFASINPLTPLLINQYISLTSAGDIPIPVDIELNTCVAIINSLSLQQFIIILCAIGIFSIPISGTRSPLPIMIPSDSSLISFIFFTPLIYIFFVFYKTFFIFNI